MTPKEKALELVLKYSYTVAGEAAIKKCALIAVDEILKQYYKLTDEYDYWQQVKTEIENL